jgi:hypothetical protein
MKGRSTFIRYVISEVIHRFVYFNVSDVLVVNGSSSSTLSLPSLSAIDCICIGPHKLQGRDLPPLP